MLFNRRTSLPDLKSTPWPPKLPFQGSQTSLAAACLASAKPKTIINQMVSSMLHSMSVVRLTKTIIQHTVPINRWLTPQNRAENHHKSDGFRHAAFDARCSFNQNHHKTDGFRTLHGSSHRTVLLSRQTLTLLHPI